MLADRSPDTRPERHLPKLTTIGNTLLTGSNFPSSRTWKEFRDAQVLRVYPEHVRPAATAGRPWRHRRRVRPHGGADRCGDRDRGHADRHEPDKHFHQGCHRHLTAAIPRPPGDPPLSAGPVGPPPEGPRPAAQRAPGA